MRRRRCGARLAVLGLPAFAASVRLLAAAASAATPSAAPPSAADLARCAAIAAAESRLACYDTLASSSAAVRPAAGATFPATPGAASPAAAAPAASAQPAAPPPPATEATSIQNFGLTAAQQHLTDLGPRAMHARITSVTRYEPGHASIFLDNDQRWVVNEDDGRLSPGDQVTIKRAAMGSYMLLSPANHTYHVRRMR
jgi:hypothetical protein